MEEGRELSPPLTHLRKHDLLPQDKHQLCRFSILRAIFPNALELASSAVQVMEGELRENFESFAIRIRNKCLCVPMGVYVDSRTYYFDVWCTHT